jgi:hypothetical protein
MIICPIPPKGQEHRIGGSDLTMALAPLLLDDKENPNYARSIYTIARRLGLVLLDNGANEGTVPSHDVLLELAKTFKVYELFIPDVMGSTVETLEQYSKFMELLPSTRTFRVAAIVQAISMYEARMMVRVYLNDPLVETIAFPRNLITNIGRTARLDLATYAYKYAEGQDQSAPTLHFLGASEQYIDEAKIVGKYYPQVRSMDTSMAYNYGLRLLLLEDEARKTRGEKVRRPRDYFVKDRTTLPIHIEKAIRANELTLERWAHPTRGLSQLSAAR